VRAALEIEARVRRQLEGAFGEAVIFGVHHLGLREPLEGISEADQRLRHGGVGGAALGRVEAKRRLRLQPVEQEAPMVAAGDAGAEGAVDAGRLRSNQLA
jgi:hypothetical protein